MWQLFFYGAVFVLLVVVAFLVSNTKLQERVSERALKSILDKWNETHQGREVGLCEIHYKLINYDSSGSIRQDRSIEVSGKSEDSAFNLLVKCLELRKSEQENEKKSSFNSKADYFN